MFFLSGFSKKEHFKKIVHILVGAFRPKHKCGNLVGDMFCAVTARDFIMLLLSLWAFFLACFMNAFALLSLLPPDEAPQPLARGRKRLLAMSAAGSVDAERRPRARASGSADAGRRPQARASGSAGAGERPQARFINAQALLDLLPGAGNSSQTKKQRAYFHRRRFVHMRTNHTARRNKSAAVKQQRSKQLKFNSSGKAVTADDVMYPAGVLAPKIRGKSVWREWMPEAIQKGAFMKGTHRQVCASLADGHGDFGKGKRSPGQVANCKFFAANTIIAGQSRGAARLRRQSLEKAFNFWITNTVFDETKLWYMIRGKGYRRFSTLAHHTQVTWEDALGIHDEDIIQTPKAMTKYTANVQWGILDGDGVAGIRGRDDERPQARYNGALTISDSHAVNILTLKYARMILPPAHIMLPTFCVQHFTGSSAAAVSEKLGIFTRVWCLSKTFAEGDFHQNLVDKMRAVLEDEEMGLEVVDPIGFQLDPHDLGPDFTTAVMERCYPCGLGPGEDTVEEGEPQQREQIKADFCKFFPFGWNRGPEPKH